MRDHTVEIVSSAAGSTISFAPVFNAAVAFVDRHLDEGRGERVLIRTAAGATVTYGAMARECDRWGKVLLEHGLRPGDRQLMMVLDGPEFFWLFWGAIKAGIVPVPINTLLRAKDYRYMIEDSGARAVVYSPELAAEVEPALQAAAAGAAGHRPAFVHDVPATRGLSPRSTAPLAPHRSAPTDDCFWLYSSGSTGFPKGAVHAHRDLAVVSQRYGVETLGIGAGDVCYSAAKLFFAYGLGNSLVVPMWVGASCVLSPARPTPELTFDLIERFRPTFYFGVPTLYAAQLGALDRAAAGATPPDLSSLRYCVSAGEALPVALFERWRERTGLLILDGIGSTEALHIFIANTPASWKPGTSGRPVVGYEARIVDERGSEVERGASGMLQIRGDSTAKYYWNKPEKTRDTMLASGWLATGDTYRQDEDGCYVCEGRFDDMMKVGGIWASPIEIEARLAEHPAVLEAAVVGRADDNELIKPEAWIVLKDAAVAASDERRAALERELLAHVKAGLAPYKYPRWWQFVSELPKTATGKIQRYKLRVGYSTDVGRDAEKLSNPENR